MAFHLIHFSKNLIGYTDISLYLPIGTEYEDMLDADDLKLPALAAVQREVGIPVGQKVRRLESVFRFIADNFQVVTLREAARILQGR